MTWQEAYEKWLGYEELNGHLKEQLLGLQEDEIEKQAAFGKQLQFETEGMTGKIGPGTNRMNIYTVKKVTAAIAQYMMAHDGSTRKEGIVIAYDEGNVSKDFALMAASTLGTYNIHAYLFSSDRPVEALLSSISELGAFGGVMITEDPLKRESSLYTLYDADGNKVNERVAQQIREQMETITHELVMMVLTPSRMKEMNLLHMLE